MCDPRLLAMIKADCEQFPTNKYIKMLITVIMFLVYSFLKGGRTISSLIGVEYCGVGFWILNILLGVTAFILLKIYGN